MIFTNDCLRLMVCSACIGLFSFPVLAGNYEVVTHDGFDSGWSMDGGTISTSGFVGTLDDGTVNSLLTDWSVRFSSPTASYELTPGNSSFTPVSTRQGESGIVELDLTDIWVPFDAFGLDLRLSTDSGQEILWDAPRFRQDFGFVTILHGSITLTDDNQESRVSFGNCDVAPGCSPPRGLTVATVPEPRTYGGWLVMVWSVFALLARDMKAQGGDGG